MISNNNNTHSYHDRRLDDGGLELLVQWQGGEETWEPYETRRKQRLDEYEPLV